MDKERLKGKNVLITGAAQGMGAAIAEHYCAQGAKVCITDVNLDGCKEVEERIRSAGGEAISCKLDVRKREDHIAAVNATVEAFGSLNVSLNNAGVNKPLWFMDVTEENYDFIFDKSSDLVMLYSDKRFDISDQIIQTISRSNNRKKLDSRKEKKEFDQQKRQEIKMNNDSKIDLREKNRENKIQEKDNSNKKLSVKELLEQRKQKNSANKKGKD